MNKQLLKLFSLLFAFLICSIEALADDYSYQGTIEIKVGETKYIQLPTNIYSTAITGYYPQGKWVLSSNNNNAEIVSGWGELQGCKVKGNKAGKNIKLTFSGNSVLYDMLWSFTGYYLIDVIETSVSVSSISVSPSSTSLRVGETKQLSATVSPSNATNKSVSWSSSNTSIATVSSSGLVTAKAAGSATITCKANDGSGKYGTCTVTVNAAAPVKVTNISLNYSSLSLVKNDTRQLRATVSPSNATDKTVTWTTSNSSVATVSSDGLVTAVSGGTATITCKANDGSGVKTACEVNVSNVKNYSVFTAKTVEGVEMKFYVADANKGECRVGYSIRDAVDVNTTGPVTIPSEVEGLKVTSIYYRAFSDCKGITKVTIPNTVETIDDYAFNGCTGLTTVALGNGVKRINGYAFYGCSSLSTITGISQLEYIGSSVFNLTYDTYIPWYNNLPDGLLYLGKVLYKYKGTMPDNTTVNVNEGTTMVAYAAFRRCNGLVGLKIPKSVNTIGNDIVDYCPNLASISVADGNEKYDSRGGCNAIVETAKNLIIAGCKNTTFPSTVTAIGYDAFEGAGLTELIIPNNIDSIASYAFTNNYSLVSLAIGKGTRTISGYAFNGCTKLNSIAVATTNPYYDSRDNCNAIIEKATNKLILGCPATVIPSSVKEIGEYAFRNNDYNVYSLSFVDNVESIENYAAEYNYKLTSLVLGKKIKKIGKEAFYGCGALRTIHSLAIEPAEMDESAFNYYSSNPDSIYKSTTLYVPIGSKINYMTSEGWNKFKKIVEITDDAVPEGMAFKAKTAEGADLWFKVTDANKKTCELIGSSKYISGKVTIPANPEGYALTSIADNAFYTYDDERRVTEIIIPEGVTSIGNSAFESRLKTTTSIMLPSTLTTIGNWAFEDCAINSIVIPKAVSYISRGIFGGCSSLEQITVETGNMVYESLEGSNAIIEKATNKLIAGCKTTQIPENVVVVGANAFRYLDGFTSVTIPASVKEIEKYAFYSCRDLKSVISLSTMPSPIDNFAFANYEGYVDGQSVYSFTSATLYVPIGCKSIYQSTEGWKNFQNIVEFDPSTLVKHVTMDNDKDAPVFDLFGRKLAQPKKGINIINGRKVIVK